MGGGREIEKCTLGCARTRNLATSLMWESHYATHARQWLDDEASGFLLRVTVTPPDHHGLLEFHHFDIHSTEHSVNA